MGERALNFSADQWAAMPNTQVPYSGTICGAGLTDTAVSIELENVIFQDGIQVKLYSGETLLTTATLASGATPCQHLN